MKRYFILTLVLLSCFSLPAQEIFFPSKEGTTLTYQNFDKKGKLSGRIKYTIKEVRKSGDDMDITYHIEMMDDKEARQYIDEVTIRKRGDKMFFDMSNFLDKKAFPHEEGNPPTLEVTGNNLELPVIPVPGMLLPDASVSVSMKMGFINLKMSANVTNRKVEAVEDISVKGGTFKAFKITSDVSSSILGVKINSRGADWYAYKIGVVKNVSYNKKGEVESSMELIEIQE